MLTDIIEPFSTNTTLSKQSTNLNQSSLDWNVRLPRLLDIASTNIELNPIVTTGLTTVLEITTVPPLK